MKKQKKEKGRFKPNLSTLTLGHCLSEEVDVVKLHQLEREAKKREKPIRFLPNELNLKAMAISSGGEIPRRNKRLFRKESAFVSR